MPPGFTPETKEFFEKQGWRLQEGRTFDQILYGNHEMGPLRTALQGERHKRAREALKLAGERLSLLEGGCGGSPEFGVLGDNVCGHYTGVDISPRGLEVARGQLSQLGIPFELREADLCRLPFDDASFDAAYSAHAIYHIDDPESQAAAFRELARVVRPGGVAMFILANPRPLLFPARLVMRMVADTPGLSDVAKRLHRKSLVPYRPMRLGWMRKQLEPFGSVTISCYALESMWFNRHVSEYRAPGRQLWELIHGVERRYARHIAMLGNYVQIVLRKR
jgi:ubiquinone/menaquinone biosynthesis C-methylase UbiE